LVFKPSIEVNFISRRDLCLEFQLLLSKSSELIISTSILFPVALFFCSPPSICCLPFLLGFCLLSFHHLGVLYWFASWLSSGFVRELNSQCWELSQRSRKCKRQSLLYTPLLYSILLYLVAVFSSVSLYSSHPSAVCRTLVWALIV
jgi:hypothetical protein